MGYSPWGRKELDMPERAQTHLTTGKTVSSVRNLIMVVWVERCRLTTRKHKETFWRDRNTLFVDCGCYIDNHI